MSAKREGKEMKKNTRAEERLDVVGMRAKNYSSNVLISTWQEETRNVEIKLKDFQRKQSKSDLKVDRSRRTIYHLFQTLPMVQEGQFVRYGQIVQIVTPHTPSYDGQLGLTLCGTVTEFDIDKYEHLSAQSLVNASPMRKPYVKNLFKVMPTKGSTNAQGGALRYGEEFLICSSGSWSGEPLIVTSYPPRAISPGNALNHGVVRFTSKEDSYCKWKAIVLERHMIEATEGHPILPNTRLIIKQVMTNKSLSAEPTLWYQTFFGLETEMSVYDAHTPKRVDAAHSIWMFATSEKVN